MASDEQKAVEIEAAILVAKTNLRDEVRKFFSF